MSPATLKIGYLLKISIIAFICASDLIKAENFTLKSISVLIRHGDRTPEKTAMYPTDPYLNRSYYPVPLGGLTNIGKKREYELGQFIRKRYNEFLGNIYYPGDVYARSTAYDRTKMSLLLALAGLYPPSEEQKWSSDLAWQPIPTMYMPIKRDSLLRPTDCPTFGVEFERVLQSEKYKTDFSQFREDLTQLSKFTGFNITKSSQVLGLYHTLLSEKGLNLTLPEWTKPYFPKGAILKIGIFDLITLSYNTKLTRLNGGKLLRKFLNDASDVKKGRQVPKIFLYSGHEITVSALLMALKTWKPEIPEYSSSVFLELWEKHSEYYVKVVYYKGIPAETEDLKIPGCSEFCLLKDFTTILRDNIADDYDRECFE